MQSDDSAQPRYDERPVPVAGGRVRVRRIEPAQRVQAGGPVLVFIHEALGCIDMWRDVPARLAAMTGLPALVYERLGHGRADPLARSRDVGYLAIEAEDVLPIVLGACGVADPVLVGHSDGGTIALLYAARHRVRAVVTEAAHVFVEEATLAGIRDAVRAWRATDLRARLARYHGDKTEALFAAWSDTWLSQSFRDWNIEARLAGVAAPCLVIQGADDEYGTERQVAAIAAGVSGPARTLVVPDCGHVPHLQAADRVLPAIADFVREQLG